MGGANRSTFLAAATFAAVIAACGSGTATESPATAAPSQAAASTATAAASTPTAAPSETLAATPTAAASEPTADPFALVAPYEGTYSGTWINETFGSTGDVRVRVSIDRTAGTIQLKLTLGGNVFGNQAPKPETLTATIAAGKGLSFDSKTFGETTLGVDLEGGAPVVTMTSPDVPSARIKTFTATTTIVNPSKLRFEYVVTFRDGVPPATGKATLTR